MQFVKFILTWLLVAAWAKENNAREKMTDKASREVKEFFEKIENVVGKVMDDSRIRKTAAPDKKNSIPREGMEKHIKSLENYNLQTELAEDFENFHLDNKIPVSNLDEIERRGILDFEGYQEFVFRPLYNCDRYDSGKRHCVFSRQLGTTLTLGVYIGEGIHRGMRVYWYRCLKKKHMDNIIKEPLSKNFLPWNLNLGGTENELRISPITETDLGNNYFVAELVAPRAYSEKYGKKPSIRFIIEPIHIDMGSLYHGEEIIIYSRSFMELPRRSMSFRWSLFDSTDLEDRGLPSNMRFNVDRSSVVIKELKTYQDQILTCKVYSNKEILLARRNFLFRGFSSDKATNKSNHIRYKRNIGDTEEFYKSNRINSAAENPSNNEKYDVKSSFDNTAFRWDKVFPEIPEVSANLFYDNDKLEQSFPEIEPHKRFLRADETPPFTAQENNILNNMRKFIHRETLNNKLPRSGEFQTMEDGMFKNNQHNKKPRFEDVDSQTIATCQSNSDCNVYAICTQAPFSGQKFCQCRHGYNGNGIFCFSS